MQEIAEAVQGLSERMQRMEQTLEAFGTILKSAGRKEKNALRRQHYIDAKRRREEGLLSLPEHNVCTFRDKRLRPKLQGWAEAGMRFGRAARPEQFITYVVHQWNNCTYLKKPITFSGSSFRIWGGQVRYAYGALDLLGYRKRGTAVQLFRNDGEYDDFKKRPWWDWASYCVFKRVFNIMQELPGFDELPERFTRLMCILVGGSSMYEVPNTGVLWDTNETRENLNRMLKHIGTDLHLVQKACWVGLRVRGVEPPVPVPT